MNDHLDAKRSRRIDSIMAGIFGVLVILGWMMMYESNADSIGELKQQKSKEIISSKTVSPL